MDGWFAPASEILDRMVAEVGVRTLSPGRVWPLENMHVLDRASTMLARRTYIKIKQRRLPRYSELRLRPRPLKRIARPRSSQLR